MLNELIRQHRGEKKEVLISMEYTYHNLQGDTIFMQSGNYYKTLSVTLQNYPMKNNGKLIEIATEE